MLFYAKNTEKCHLLNKRTCILSDNIIYLLRSRIEQRSSGRITYNIIRIMLQPSSAAFFIYSIRCIFSMRRRCSVPVEIMYIRVVFTLE